MNSPAFLLALAPAATAVASRTVAAAKNAGESFVSLLGNSANSASVEGVQRSTESGAGTLSPAESLQAFAGKLRNWLSDHGVGNDFSIDFHLAADGEVQWNASGDSADDVKRMLALEPTWLEQLQKLASAIQIQSAQVSRDYSARAVAIEIDQHSAKAY